MAVVETDHLSKAAGSGQSVRLNLAVLNYDTYFDAAGLPQWTGAAGLNCSSTKLLCQQRTATDPQRPSKLKTKMRCKSDRVGGRATGGTAELHRQIGSTK